MYFLDRQDAGEKLAIALLAYRNHPQAVVLGLVRGGVATAAAIAKELHLPLGVMCVKKIGAPFHQELALGAVCADGASYINEELAKNLSVDAEFLLQEQALKQEQASLSLKRFLSYAWQESLKGKIAILVDDGLATGATMKASIASAKAQGASKVVVAVPVAAHDSFSEIELLADEAVALSTPYNFMAVGEFYRDFSQTEDEEVVRYLQEASGRS